MARDNYIEHYTGSACFLPELEALGFDAHAAAMRRLEPHVHPRAYEICLISRGEVNWWAGRKVFRVGKGDLYITGPDEEHGGVDSMMHTCELYFLQIAFPSRKALPGLTLRQTRLLRARFGALQYRCFAGPALVHDSFQQLMHAQREGGDFAVIAGRAALHQLLLAVLDAHDAAVAQQRGRAREQSAVIRRALRWIDDHLDEDHPVEQIAAMAGLGVSRFHERFLEEVGFSPNDYRARRRVERSKVLLADREQSITQVAMEMGFSSSQYYATVFRKYTGMTPSRYRDAYS